MANILSNKEILRKIEPFFLPLVVVLVGLTAFGLGRLSYGGVGERPQLIIKMPDGTTQSAATYAARNQAAPAASKPALTSGQIVASKSGTKYYLPSCSGVSRIKEENKVWFANAEEAQAAGYEPAANCPGI